MCDVCFSPYRTLVLFDVIDFKARPPIRLIKDDGVEKDHCTVREAGTHSTNLLRRDPPAPHPPGRFWYEIDIPVNPPPEIPWYI
jgi:hypothetical protein